MLMMQTQRESMPPAYGPEQGIDLQQYLAILRRRLAYLLIPFVLIAAVGGTVVMLLPPVYLAEGKILVESQQIPTDLVRPTIIATANERIQVIEQRIMTRDNLLAIVEKFHMFPSLRNKLSTTQLLDHMRQRTHISPYELNPTSRGTGLTIALTIGFEYEQPEIAMRVTNELITLILAEDARNRASRAQETTKFLAQEAQKLESALGKIDGQIADYRRKHNTESNSDKTSLQVALLVAELQEKASVFSSTHPDVVRLKRQLAALEKAAAETAQVQGGLETLQNQRAATQRQLDAAGEKLSAARLGENLERAQFSERLEVLEQAIAPQRPLKPNRPKLLALVLGLAVGAAVACVVVMETLDKSIRGTRDLYGTVAATLVVGLPYISTRQEVLRRKYRIVLALTALAAMLVGGLLGVHYFWRPLDELFETFVSRVFG